MQVHEYKQQIILAVLPAITEKVIKEEYNSNRREHISSIISELAENIAKEILTK